MNLKIARFFATAILLIPMVVSASVRGETPLMTNVHGRVVDTNQAGIAGAKVTVVTRAGLRSVSTLTDENGEFSLNLPSLEYILSISAEGFLESTHQLDARTGEPKTLEIT